MNKVMTCIFIKLSRRALPTLLLAAVMLEGLGVAQNTQVPTTIRNQVSQIQDRFATVLNEECSPDLCFPIGCQASRFDTLDEQVTSSLPGLETPAPIERIDHRLVAAVCEFTHESALAGAELNNLRQRLTQKVKQVGVDVMIQARALPPRHAEQVPPVEQVVPPTLNEELIRQFLPFLPWLVTAFVICFIAMLLIWAMRRLGHPVARQLESQGRNNDDNLTPHQEQAAAVPSTQMLMTRIAQLRSDLEATPEMIEPVLRKHLENDAVDELAMYLHCFGAELLEPLKDKVEYKETLTKLSDEFAEMKLDDLPANVWAFLDRTEKHIIAAKIALDLQPLDREFGFLASLDVDEFLSLLKEVSESEAIAAISYAPYDLRERFFAQASSAFTAKFIAQLANVEKLPDSFVRKTANKLRTIYLAKGVDFKTIKVNRAPLLEQALNALEPNRRRELFSDLGRENPEIIRQLAPTIFLDDSLPFLTDQQLTEVFLNVSPQEAAIYLSQHDWGTDVLNRLKPRLQNAVRMSLRHGDIDSQELQEARQKIVRSVKELEQKGQIDLKAINARIIDAQ